jgi:TRAP-type C4-dicarboxylate transport system permease small subunit
MRIRPLIDLLVRASTAVAGLALLVMVLVLVADVAMANLFNRPIVGTFDLVETTLVVLVFLGFPSTFLRNGHIAVDVIDHMVSPDAVSRLKRLAGALSLAFLLFLAYQMLWPAFDAWRFGERKQELGLPLWVVWIPMIVGVAISAAALIASLTRRDRPPKE